MGKYLKINGANFSANAIGQVAFVIEPPVITNEGSVVTIITTEYGGTIYYTTDGSNPTSQSNVYSGSFTVVNGTTIKAIVVVNSTASTVTSKTIGTWTPVDLSTIKIRMGIDSGSTKAYPDYEIPFSSSSSTDLINKPFRITTKSGYVLKYLFYVDANTLMLTESPNTPGQVYDTIDVNTLTINPLATGLNYQITIKKSDGSNFGSETPSDIIDTFEIIAN